MGIIESNHDKEANFKMSDKTFTKMSWDQFDEIILKICSFIREKKFEPTIIVAIQRGGFIPAVTLSHQLSVREMIPINIVRTNTNSRFSDKREPQLIEVSCLREVKNKNVLLVDDIVGTGITLAYVYEIIKKNMPKGIISAVLCHCNNSYNKENNGFRADFVGVEFNYDWMVFPWEKK